MNDCASPPNTVQARRVAKSAQNHTRRGTSSARANKTVRRCRTCRSCRLRKSKCDGIQPRCGLCTELDRECTYPEDARCFHKPTKLDVQTLEATIESLQKTLRDNNIVIDQAAGDTTARSQLETEELNVEDPSTSARKSFSRETGTGLISTGTVHIDRRRSLSPETTVSGSTTATGRLADKDSGPSPSEVQVAGAVSRDGDTQVHGVSSMFHRQFSRNTNLPESSISERGKRNEMSRMRLVANSALQRQREALFMGNPRLTATPTIDFDGVDPDLAIHLIELHFNRTHFTYLFSYRPAITDSLITNGPYSNKILLNAIYFCSSLYSDRPELRLNSTEPQSTGERFYRRILALLADHIDRPAIPTAVGLLLCGAALVSTGRPSAGWIHCGIAYRMIIDLGCHLLVESRRTDLDDENALLTDVEVEIRKRLYWGAFLTDSTQSLYFGRPPSLRTSQARVPQLLLDTYEELEIWSPYVDPLSLTPTVVSYRPYPAYAISTFNAMVGLFEISSRIVHTFYSIHSLQHSSGHLHEAKSTLESELEHWWVSLPAHLRFKPGKGDPTPPPHQIPPLTTYHTLQILLQRPFLANGHLNTHFNEDERRSGEGTSVNAALSIWRLIESYKATFTLRQAPYLISYSVYSAIVAILTQKSLQRAQFTECMSFFWSALTDLQRGSNFGLQKPIEILKDMMHQFGEVIPQRTETMNNQLGASRGINDPLGDLCRGICPGPNGDLDGMLPMWDSSPQEISTLSNPHCNDANWPSNDTLFGLFNPDPYSF